MNPMTPDDIIEAYKIVAADAAYRGATEAARVGNAQRSLGTLAERVASPSGQTSGLANYTYNRTMRPTVESTTASLITTGYANALANNLKTSLRAAKNKYEDAKNRYTVASAGGGNNNNNNNNNNTKEQTDNSYTGKDNNANAKKGTIIGVTDKGNGKYDVTVADGNGGYDTHTYDAKNEKEAREKYNDNYNTNGTEKSATERYMDRYTKNPTTPLQKMADKVWNNGRKIY